MKRDVITTIDAVATSDGDGVKISRAIGSRLLPQFDPFLLLDELSSDEAADYMGGFPPHPHRGFETVTYMLEGQMRHKDSVGNEGVIGSGDLQWMTAGSGIIHSEMPEQTAGRLWGFQLWINLPAAEKMQAPRYQEINTNNIPEIKNEQGTLRILSGEVNGVVGPISGISTQPLLLDLQLKAGAEKNISLPSDHAAMIYVYRGMLSVNQHQLQQKQLGQLSQGDDIEIKAGEAGVGALVLAAAPLNEAIVRSGPFVMNTQAELEQAYADYRNGSFAR